MNKEHVLHNVKNNGVVAVIRGKDMETAYRTAISCIIGGIKSIEVTFTAPNADKIISKLKSDYPHDDSLAIGAGTVLEPVSARIAIMAGADFIVSPTFNKDVALMCNLYGIVYMPGCMTVTEIQTAISYGSDIVKVFPGSVLGMNYISAVKAPLPQVNIMPTGGVSLENMKDWFAKGVVAVGAGSSLTAPADHGDFDKVTEIARKYCDEFTEIKKTKK
ncbi:MAG TPA: bifunctional 2-keto-4-hydroxyglutarate aldolase/2-keto-3-deoxy-6-phosphogluconate aldolase [Companilactobacillus farciminis]|uniref:Bifunctional 2-keto-4-hydroxyglutarate aldolase/2-keto-3-deoxy-6-phosphogluconate aldolase n=3 Tax=Companilactobacillus TaxID=2767879 RepID=A0A921LAH9_9LACO|nr:bifunctional 2-keto-4-hydroxyglutarate aldolase/2-keto-3-deoxy-6-phosphogluconate aldolase [Companilactobacillus futsaii]KRK91260.1 2-dehydro-3-deoxyphosphogluconate aldolase [Companilactobacillus futsaii JCM 17355]QCX25802.1 bifunctional 4-hydroxy-2-oxoglutarate aldolase/2-dehydro-3-deoxy-phosphogluconate aldolase [Companilactobacillus futsaii]HJF87522.1 bifunctional 2-keto-4-hydroxyglutarate aldolase/2-keto-3-deoxy-6-phosphogluconate aldolase [Companilactobacillus farciminis]